MMDNSCIDLSLVNIWKSWFEFRKGKRATNELENFSYYLEQNLQKLYFDLNASQYKHGDYKKFVVADNKRREINVASIRDRVVHRLIYQYLHGIYDKTFIFDVWSCRKNKGLLGAIARTQKFLNKYSNSFIWRADIRKFFDNVNQPTLLGILTLKIKDNKATDILKEIIASYFAQSRERERESKISAGNFMQQPFWNICKDRIGMPIGNLTSQIFANIYLNEVDRLIKHIIKPQAYLRYGDDFIIIAKNINQLKRARTKVIIFLKETLQLEINAKHDIIIKARWGLKFLGVIIFPKGRKLSKRNWNRVRKKLNYQNISSYSGLIKQHSNEKRIKEFSWTMLETLSQEV